MNCLIYMIGLSVLTDICNSTPLYRLDKPANNIYSISSPYTSKLSAQNPVTTHMFETNDDGSFPFAIRFLRKYGYIGKSDSIIGVVQTMKPELLAKAVRRYQEYNGLPVTGKLDRRTRSKMHDPRCGVPDIEDDDKEQHQRGKRYNHAKHGVIEKKKVTYKLVDPSFTPSLRYNQIQHTIIDRAFATWQKYIDVEFVRVSSEEDADMTLGFKKGKHGDGLEFDGPSGALGHAFYPDDPHWGKVHFDEEDNWSPTARGYDRSLQWVATHEIGHALGLAHSTDPESIMMTDYRGTNSYDVDLSQDDIDGILGLYEARNECEDISRDHCIKRRICQNPRFDSIFQIHDSMGEKQTYFVQDNLIYRLKSGAPHWTFDEPTTIGKMFHGIDSPDRVEEAFTDYFSYTRVYYNNKVWVYDFSNSAGTVLSSEAIIRNATYDRQSIYKDLPQYRIDGVMIIPSDSVEDFATYFFQGNKYFRNAGDRPHGNPEEKPMSLFTIAPLLKKVDATFMVGGQYMLFSGDEYYIVAQDQRTKFLKAVDNKPHRTTDLLNCNPEWLLP